MNLLAKKVPEQQKKDIAELQIKLEVPIFVKILPNRIFYISGYYQSKSHIEIIDHKFHAWVGQ